MRIRWSRFRRGGAWFARTPFFIFSAKHDHSTSRWQWVVTSVRADLGVTMVGGAARTGAAAKREAAAARTLIGSAREQHLARGL